MKTASLSHKTNILVFKYLKNHILKSSLKAFIFAYLYVTLPKVIKICSKTNCDRWRIIKKVLKNALHPSKFPMFSARLIAGINTLEPIMYTVLKSTKLKSVNLTRFGAVFLASFITAALSFPDFQFHLGNYNRFYSLDLTLLLVTRALDTTLSSLSAQVLPAAITANGDALLFIASSFIIMFNWFYHPEKLPHAYRDWITSAADMDNEMVTALRLAHGGTLDYGVHSSEEDVLKPLCDRYGIDPKLGNFALTCPIPCDIIHAGQTSSCGLHAIWRFCRGFKFAFSIYGPLNILTLLIPRKQKILQRLIRAFTSSIRSSTFLATFIALNWYGVCLTRTIIGPVLFPHWPKSSFDRTAAPTVGSLLCGFSGLIETASRRKELALFVAPRALGAILPSEANELYLKIEAIAFSLSFATLVAYSKQSPDKIRGIFGKGLKQVFDIDN